MVIGCAAIGGKVAAGLARGGHEVLACDAGPAVVAAINERGLRIEGPVENFTAGGLQLAGRGDQDLTLVRAAAAVEQLIRT